MCFSVRSSSFPVFPPVLEIKLCTPMVGGPSTLVLLNKSSIKAAFSSRLFANLLSIAVASSGFNSCSLAQLISSTVLLESSRKSSRYSTLSGSASSRALLGFRLSGNSSVFPSFNRYQSASPPISLGTLVIRPSLCILIKPSVACTSYPFPRALANSFAPSRLEQERSLIFLLSGCCSFKYLTIPE